MKNVISFTALLLTALLLQTKLVVGAELRGQTEVNRPAVRLSDVFTDVPEGIDRDIAMAPAPGKSVAYDLRILRQLASQYRLDWQPQTIADHAVLVRASTHLTQDTIRVGVMQKIKELNPEITNNKSIIEVAFETHNIDIYLPADQAPDFVLNNFDYDPSTRHFHAEIQAGTGGSQVTMPVQGHVTIKREVPVLAHRMESGMVIGKSDLGVMVVGAEHLGADVVTSAESLIGRELRHDMAEDQLLRSRDVMAQRLVSRGSLVTMKIETPYMSITTQGKALQDGGLGDVIKLTNIQSNRAVEGTVTGPEIVSIKPPGSSSLHAELQLQGDR